MKFDISSAYTTINGRDSTPLPKVGHYSPPPLGDVLISTTLLLDCELPLISSAVHETARQAAQRLGIHLRSYRKARAALRKRVKELGGNPAPLIGKSGRPGAKVFADCRGRTVKELANVIDANEIRHWKD